MAETSDADMFEEANFPAESSTTYHWFIVFEWNHKTDKPFSIHVINPTFVNIIPNSWLKGRLEVNCRMQKLRIKTLTWGIGYSIFGKIEKGNDILNF